MSATLNIQGAKVPQLGFGTWEITGSAATEAVHDALEIGYRHIDTARAYGNEREVGLGIADSGVDRGDIFLTTKLWYSRLRADEVHEQLEGSLRDLGTDYVDLLLIHWPNADVPLAETLGAMSELRDAGKVRHLGVSNFPSALVRKALDIAPILTDQVEYHPYLGQPELLALARERDLMLTAYSPLAHGRLLDDPVLREIGETHAKNPGQVALRWLLDQPQVAVLPKAGSHANRVANFDVFDFALDDEQRGQIAALERGHRTADPSWAPAWD